MMLSKFKSKKMDLMTDQLFAEDYQKEKYNARHVKELADAWDPAKCDPLKVGYENGKYYVFCGQHRRAAAILANGGNPVKLPCIVFYGTTYADRARMFAEEDDLKYNTTPRQKYNALYLAGDEEMIAVCEAVEESGYTCTFSKQGGDVDCTVLARSIYRKHGSEFLTEVFTIIYDAWGKSSKATNHNIVKGVVFFLERYGELYKSHTLTKGLKRVSPENILDIAKNTIEQSKKIQRINWDYAVSLELVKAYNSVCRGSSTRLDARLMLSVST